LLAGEGVGGGPNPNERLDSVYSVVYVVFILPILEDGRFCVDLFYTFILSE
jgi:hypothetical protein